MSAFRHWIIAAVAVVATLIVVAATTGRTQSMPNWINYQGRLTLPSGAPVTDGPYEVVFRLFDAPTGGSALWQEQASVTTKGGVFSATLGRSTLLEPSLFTKRLWLETSVGERTLKPRQELGSVAFAITALSMPQGGVTTAMIANLSITTDKLADGSVTASKLASDSASLAKVTGGSASVEGSNIGIGTTNPQGKLDVRGKVMGGGTLAGIWAAQPTQPELLEFAGWTGWTDMPGMEVSFTVDRPVLVWANYSVNMQPDAPNSGALFATRLVVNGQPNRSSGFSLQPFSQMDENDTSWGQCVVPVPAGSINVKLQWLTFGDTKWSTSIGWLDGYIAGRTLVAMAMYQ